MTEQRLIKLIARIAPWLGPVPSAWLVGRAVELHLSFPWYMALVTALVVESLGLVSMYNWQNFTDWNRRKLKTDAPAPAGLPLALGVFYLALTIGLVVILEVVPSLATYAPAAMPLLAAVGTINLTLLAGQEAREAAAQREKMERKALRNAGKEERKAEKMERIASAKAAQRAEKAREADEQAREAAEHSLGNALRTYHALTENPSATGEQLAQSLGISRRSIVNHLSKIEQAGLIKRNGNGLEILGEM